MAKKQTYYECTACGHREPKWLGQCPSCGEWNTLVERHARGGRNGSTPSSRRTPHGASSNTAETPGGGLSKRLSEIDPEHSSRISTGIGELDRALGGGLMPGSTVLIGGEPGIGKSTLMLQMAFAGRGGEALYVTGEESAAQIRQRAERLGILPLNTPSDAKRDAGGRDISLLCTTYLDDLLDELERLKPRVVVIDSVQMILASEVGSVPGTINQIKYVTHEIAEWARRTRSCALMVAHVTKEGQIAGPKVVEHMVDAVLLFEHSGGDVRYVRATKNRFGAIEEVGIFTMEHDGLNELRDPGRIFLGRGVRPAGVVAAPCYEGSRVLVVEIQALTVSAKGSVSRSFSDRIDNRRISRVAAVLEKHVGIRFSDQDLYVNVAGGIRTQDVAIDLPLALALYSARTGSAIPAGLLATGELSLAGEVRPISHRMQRERSAVEMGFERLVGPAATNDTLGTDGVAAQESGTWVNVHSLPEAIKAVFGEASATQTHGAAPDGPRRDRGAGLE